jgi:hypothetical protein
MENVVIFESTDRGATKVFGNDDEGCLLTFNRQNINLIKTADGDLKRSSKSDSWICLVDTSTEEGKLTVERAKKHRDFVVDTSDDFYNGLKFRIIDKIPTSKTGATIVKVLDVDQKNKTKRFGFLEGSILKTDGSYRADATEEEIAEYESLKKEVG